jgi:hypothetical protein
MIIGTGLLLSLWMSVSISEADCDRDVFVGAGVDRDLTGEHFISCHWLFISYLESYSDYSQNLFDRYVAYADAWDRGFGLQGS